MNCTKGSVWCLVLFVVAIAVRAGAGDPSLFSMSDKAFKSYATSELPNLILNIKASLGYKSKAGYGEDSFANAAIKQSTDVMKRGMDNGKRFDDAQFEGNLHAADMRGMGRRYDNMATKCDDIEKAARARSGGKVPSWMLAILKPYDATSCETIHYPFGTLAH